jgi:prolyl-tRNA synthetase
MKGVPLRIEIGPKDIEQNQCIVARRDNGEKITVSLNELETVVPDLLSKIHKNLYEKAAARLAEKTFTAHNLHELKSILDTTPGHVKAMWCGADACELRVKEDATATSRCIPFAQENIGDTCFVCGEKADKMVVWGRAY